MSLGHVVLYLFSAWGISWALSLSHSGYGLRQLTRHVPVLGLLVSCPSCLAFWCGLGLAFLGFAPTIAPAAPIASKLAAAFAAAGFTRFVMPAEASDA